MKIAPVAEIKAQFSTYLRSSTEGPVIVTRHGKPVRWAHDPDSGGVKVPDAVRRRTENRYRYFGDEERCGFGLYSYAGEGYELSMFPTGAFYGRPKDALEVSGEMHLR